MSMKTPEPALSCIFLLARGRRGARLLDVARDLLDQLGLAPEGALVPQPAPQLDDEARAVEVAGEVEQEGLDPALVAAVVRVDADRYRRSRAGRLARVDAVGGDEQVRRRVEVRRREAEAGASMVASDDRPLDLDGAAEQPRRMLDVPAADEAADARRGDPFHERHRARVDAQRPQQVQVAHAITA